MPVHCHNNRNAPLKPMAIRSFATGLLLFFADWRTNEMAVVSLTIQQKIELKAAHCLLTLGKTFKFEQNANRTSLFIEISRANRRCGTEAIAVSAVSILPIFSTFTWCIAAKFELSEARFCQGHTFTDQLIHTRTHEEKTYLVCMVKQCVNA